MNKAAVIVFALEGLAAAGIGAVVVLSAPRPVVPFEPTRPVTVRDDVPPPPELRHIVASEVLVEGTTSPTTIDSRREAVWACGRWRESQAGGGYRRCGTKDSDR